ncbi:MAG: porin, partial [Pseudomonadota bacterium]|nr:porin [Pseudomonadota bacterium]
MSLVLSPALAQSDRTKAQRGAPSVRNGPVGSFTPAVADRPLAAALARRGNSNNNSFRFTPATASVDRNRPVRVAVRARASTPQEANRGSQGASASPVTAITPSSYNLGASVGWRSFAITGDVARTDGGIVPGSRSSAQVGMSYRPSQRITARVQASAEQAEGRQRNVAEDEAYALDVGGSYSIARNLDVTGGVRYRIAR